MTNHRKGTKIGPCVEVCPPPSQALTPTHGARPGGEWGNVSSKGEPMFVPISGWGWQYSWLKCLDENGPCRPTWGSSLSVFGRIIYDPVIWLSLCSSRKQTRCVVTQEPQLLNSRLGLRDHRRNSDGLLQTHLTSVCTPEWLCPGVSVWISKVMLSLSTEQVFYVIKSPGLWKPTAGNAGEESGVSLHAG